MVIKEMHNNSHYYSRSLLQTNPPGPCCDVTEKHVHPHDRSQWPQWESISISEPAHSALIGGIIRGLLRLGKSISRNDLTEHLSASGPFFPGKPGSLRTLRHRRPRIESLVGLYNSGLISKSCTDWASTARSETEHSSYRAVRIPEYPWAPEPLDLWV